tara:strand:- start:2293 stop:2403 length:111 start_codon:yes stop_codon:yes gene_type:complete
LNDARLISLRVAAQGTDRAIHGRNLSRAFDIGLDAI